MAGERATLRRRRAVDRAPPSRSPPELRRARAARRAAPADGRPSARPASQIRKPPPSTRSASSERPSSRADLAALARDRQPPRRAARRSRSRRSARRRAERDRAAAPEPAAVALAQRRRPLRRRAPPGAASIIRAAASTSARLCGWAVASSPERSRTPSVSPVSGSRTGAALQVHSWTETAKCSAEKTCSGCPAASAVPIALVPAPLLAPARAALEVDRRRLLQHPRLAVDPQHRPVGVADQHHLLPGGADVGEQLAQDRLGDPQRRGVPARRSPRRRSSPAARCRSIGSTCARALRRQDSSITSRTSGCGGRPCEAALVRSRQRQRPVRAGRCWSRSRPTAAQPIPSFPGLPAGRGFRAHATPLQPPACELRQVGEMERPRHGRPRGRERSDNGGNRDQGPTRARASSPPQTHPMLIGADWVEAAAGKTFDVYDPSTGEVLGKVARGGSEDIDRAVKTARAAFETGPWSTMTALRARPRDPPPRRPDPRARRRARDARVARQRQAARRRPRRRRAAGRRPLPLHVGLGDQERRLDPVAERPLHAGRRSSTPTRCTNRSASSARSSPGTSRC